MTTITEHKGFLIEEGVAPPEFEPTPFNDFERQSGKFNPERVYGGWIGFRENESYRAKQLSLIEAMLDYIPFDYLRNVKFICHPLGSSGKGFLDEPDSYRGTFSWKYEPK